MNLEQIDDMALELSEIRQDIEQLIRENTLSNQEYSELRKLYIAERMECREVKEQRDSAYLNRDIAEEERDQAIHSRDIAEIEVKKLKTELIIEINKYDDIELDLDSAERHLENRTDERDTLAYENKNLAGFIKYNNSTLTDTDVGDIANSTWLDSVWDRFITPPRLNVPASEQLIYENKMLRRKITKIENICNDTNEEEVCL